MTFTAAGFPRSVRSACVATLCGAGLLLGAAGCAGDTDPPDLVGVWVDADLDGLFVDVRDDGGYSGYDGCNSFYGDYEVSGDTLSFTPTGSTLVACHDEESRDWLRGMATAEVVDGALEVSDGSGAVIGVLPKQ